MKNILLLFVLLLNFSFFSAAQTSLQGKVSSGNTGEDLISANIVLTKNGVFVAAVSTDFNGNYNVNIDPGTYDMKVSYPDYPDNIILGVTAKSCQSTKCDVKMVISSNGSIGEVVMTEYKVPLVQMKDGLYCCISSNEILNLPTRNIGPINTKATITGKITDINSCIALGDAHVTAYKNSNIANGALTDFDGNFTIRLDTGNYDIRVSYVGYSEELIENISLKPNELEILNIQLASGVTLEKVVVSAYGTECFKASTICGSFYSAGNSSRKNNSDIQNTAIVDTHSKIEICPDEVTIRSCRASPTYFYIEGVRVRNIKATGKSPKKAKHDKSPVSHFFREWDDVEKREFEAALLNRAGEDHMQNQPVSPVQQIYVEVINEDQIPVPNCIVKLTDENGLAVFKTKTNNHGKATLWPGQSASKIIAEYNGIVSTLLPTVLHSDKPVKIQLPVPCNASETIDIAFVVDATGSMAEELDFLKTELADVIRQVKNRQPDLSIRTGCVVYRDHDDEYLTRTSPFSNDLQKTVAFLDKQTATGGGDLSEAVDAALEDALSLGWSENAIARILFLVTDAPPHNQPEVLKKLQFQMQKAAEMGIRVIPIAAGTTDEVTGYFLKTLALISSGTYIFASGTDGSEEPEVVITNHRNSSLNALMAHLISAYSELMDCWDNSSALNFSNHFESDLEKENDNYSSVKMYPNPASEEVFFELNERYTKIRLVNTAGKTLKTIDFPNTGKTQMGISDLPGGVYLIQLQKGSDVITKKLIVTKQ